MQRYNSRDIEIFILSYNRGKYLIDSINCLLNQTASDLKITILDNASDGETAELISQIKNERVKIIVNSKNIGGLENFKKAQELASGEWVIIFHDDDLMNYHYIEMVLETLNSNSNITMIGTLTELREKPDYNRIEKSLSKNIVLYDYVSDFATALLKGLPVPFCSFVYKRDLLKAAKLDINLYGKIADRPFAFDCSGDGKIAIINDLYIQTRVHKERDTNDYKSGPHAEQWIYLVKKYRDIMGDNLFSKNGRTFLNRGTRSLLVTMNPYIFKEMGKKEYIKLAIERGAISKLDYYFGLPYYYLYIIAKKIVKKLSR